MKYISAVVRWLYLYVAAPYNYIRVHDHVTLLGECILASLARTRYAPIPSIQWLVIQCEVAGSLHACNC